MAAYYNEIDAFAAAWLRELIRRELIAPGDVDERSIADVQPDDVRGYTQCHFFAGIGVWSYALFNAGWADSDPVWTGSCPCQPFSPAGKGKGFSDERHLWPEFFRLIRECRPDVCFGEQTSSPAGIQWLDAVLADVEGIGYAGGAAVFPAASVGAPHQRHRIYWVADADSGRGGRYAGAVLGTEGRLEREMRRVAHGAEPGGAACAVANAVHEGRQVAPPLSCGLRKAGPAIGAELPTDDGSGLGNADDRGREGPDVPVRPARQDEAAAIERGTGFWANAEWLPCSDGKARPVEPGTFPLAHGAPARVGRLRGYGNALVAPQAQAFIEAYLDVRGGL